MTSRKFAMTKAKGRLASVVSAFLAALLTFSSPALAAGLPLGVSVPSSPVVSVKGPLVSSSQQQTTHNTQTTNNTQNCQGGGCNQSQQTQTCAGGNCQMNQTNQQCNGANCSNTNTTTQKQKNTQEKEDDDDDDD
jgi:hypothetical protein